MRRPLSAVATVRRSVNSVPALGQAGALIFRSRPTNRGGRKAEIDAASFNGLPWHDGKFSGSQSFRRHKRPFAKFRDMSIPSRKASREPQPSLNTPEIRKLTLRKNNQTDAYARTGCKTKIRMVAKVLQKGGGVLKAKGSDSKRLEEYVAALS